MSDMLHPQDKLNELVAGRVLNDLAPNEESELQAHSPQAVAASSERLERVAAAITLAFETPSHPQLPKALFDRIVANAANHLPAAKTVERSAAIDQPVVRKPQSAIVGREMLAWLCMAASLLVAIGLMVNQRTVKMNPVAARTSLLASDTSVVQVAWGKGTTPFDANVEGDVVWSNAKQEGYMRFKNMPVNDPKVEQYQLWIIDPQRDDEPIDGGVFDVSATGEVIVPIQAKLNVIEPKAFAITVEKPGGVVVSKQEKLPLLAQVK